KKIPQHTLAFGRTAKVIRELTDEDYHEMERIVKSYVDKGEYYRNYTKLGQTFERFSLHTQKLHRFMHKTILARQQFIMDEDCLCYVTFAFEKNRSSASSFFDKML